MTGSHFPHVQKTYLKNIKMKMEGLKMIREDKHAIASVDAIAIEKGYAKLDIYNVHIEREYSVQPDTEVKVDISSEEWNKHCDEIKKKVSERVTPLMDFLNKRFKIHQYEKNDAVPFLSDWDLFFWCNSKNGIRDLSYITLNTNHTRTVEQKAADVERLLEAIKEFGYEGLDITIQYTATYNTEQVKDVVADYYNTVKDTFVKYAHMEGKIKEIGKDEDGTMYYAFFKKGSRKKYFHLSNKDILRMALS